MKIEENKIIDFNYGFLIESAILECFVAPNEDILFPYFSSNGLNSFIEQRTVIKTEKWIFDWIPARGEIIQWYRPLNHYDLIEILKQEGITYTFIVIEKNETNIHNYKYLIDVYEHGQFNGEELRALYVLRERGKREVLIII